MKKPAGFVLITVLFMLSVLMLMTISQWQSVLLYQRMLSEAKAQKNTLHILEEVMRWCWQRYQAIDRLAFEGSTTLKNQEVGYRVIDKGIFPCIHFKKSGHLYSTKQVEIHTWSIKQPHLQLRVRLAKAIPLHQCAATQARLISQEVISWQYGVFNLSSLATSL